MGFGRSEEFFIRDLVLYYKILVEVEFKEKLYGYVILYCL